MIHYMFMTLTGINIKDCQENCEVYHNPFSALRCQHQKTLEIITILNSLNLHRKQPPSLKEMF